MATQLQIRRGTTAQMNAFTGAEGELAVNTSTDTVHVHDGSTAGGFALAKADGSNIGTYAGSFTTLAASGAVTLSSALAVTGEITANGGIALGDNDKATFGASDDLQIYHDGTDSFLIDNGTGRLNIRSSSDFLIANTANNQNYLYAVESGAVTLFHSGSTKLATTSTGIDVTGSVTASNPIILTAGALAAAGNAGLSHRSTDNKVYLQAGTGGFNILDDQQNTHFSIDSAGVSSFNNHVGIGTSSVSNLLHLHNTSGDSIIRMSGGGGLGVNYGGFVNGYGVAGTGGYLDIGVIDANFFRTAIQVRQQAAEIIFKNGDTERMRLTGGSLLVGGTAAGTVSGNNAMITVRRDSGNCGISYQSGTAATDQWETYSNLAAQFYIENTSTSNGAYLQYNSGSGWTNVSDERWKTNWTSLEDASSKIAALSVGKYHMLNNSKETIESAKWDYGVKAQELLLVIPDAVDVPENPEDKYGVVPNIVFWHAVKAIQEQQATIETLTARIAALES